MNYILRAAATPRVSALPNPTTVGTTYTFESSHHRIAPTPRFRSSRYSRIGSTTNMYKSNTPTNEYAKAHSTNRTFNHVGFSSDSGSDAGGAARDRLDAALPQLPQKSASGWSFSPHFMQNIVALPLPVYANSEYNWGILLQQKRRAVQVLQHPHDPNPNAAATAKG